MTLNLNPYLYFSGTAAQAMDHYRSVLGGELTLSRFRDFPMMGAADADQDLVMHSQLVVPGGIVLMGADVPSHMEFAGTPGNVSCSLSGDDVDLLTGYWEGLSAGGTVTAPFGQAPWGDWFGMCTDRFGIDWLVNAGGTPDAVDGSSS